MYLGPLPQAGRLIFPELQPWTLARIFNGVRAHCVVVLVTSDGTITIHQECVFTTNPPQGRWEIVSGTGAYANLKGNGSLTMPPNTEAMTGTIY
jgi:hypothetical protein